MDKDFWIDIVIEFGIGSSITMGIAAFFSIQILRLNTFRRYYRNLIPQTWFLKYGFYHALTAFIVYFLLRVFHISIIFISDSGQCNPNAFWQTAVLAGFGYEAFINLQIFRLLSIKSGLHDSVVNVFSGRMNSIVEDMKLEYLNQVHVIFSDIFYEDRNRAWVDIVDFKEDLFRAFENLAEGIIDEEILATVDSKIIDPRRTEHYQVAKVIFETKTLKIETFKQLVSKSLWG